MDARGQNEAPDYNIPDSFCFCFFLFIPDSLYKGALESWGDAFDQTLKTWISPSNKETGGIQNRHQVRIYKFLFKKMKK